MQPHDPNRLLGRGKPPSQPVPAYLRPLIDKGVAVRRFPVVSVAVVAALVVAIGIGVGIWYSKPKRLNADASCGQLGAMMQRIHPLDMALTTGDMRIKTDIVVIDKVWIEGCYDGANKKLAAGQCTQGPMLQRTLAKAIVTSDKCVAERGKDVTISYVWDVNYRTQKTRLFVGKSGSLGPKQVQAELACVQKALQEPMWTEQKEGQGSRCVVAVLAAYPAQKRK